ncbi:MAG: antibiotic biosynthesis monooxygenase [Chloroflexi bacterium]|nr:antibiotic biosynthesis monooxygenase [Chloroflexota bacterium]
MHARLITTHVKLENLEELSDVYRDAILPETRKNRGYIAAYLMADRESGKVASLTFWETEEDLRQDLVYIQRQIRKVLDLLTGPPVVEIYEVNVADPEP